MVIFFWTPPHFWALAIKYKDDYAAAGIPMLPVVAPIAKVEQQMWFHSIAMFTTSYLTLYSAALPAWSYVANTALTIFFAIQMFSLKSSQIEKSAAKIFHGSITYLSLYSILLVAAIFITF
jgi:protoheme IX farnesyltransferase